MVTVTAFKTIARVDGKKFNVLVLQGGIEVAKSQRTGKPYISAKRCNMPCAFDDLSCQALIGTKLPGSIVKQSCEPYEYIIPETEEVIQLDYTWAYSPDATTVEETVFQGEKVVA